MRLFLLLLLVCGAYTLSAQKTMEGSEIIAMLDAGKDVTINNTTITGNMDFTRVADRERENKSGDQRSYRCHVRNSVTFINCTFNGKVLGYRNTNKNGSWSKDDKIFNTDFHRDFVFKDCTFKKAVNFKYTRFYNASNFNGANFEEAIGFKYTKFDEVANFASAVFGDQATFKYTSFPDGANFSGAKFKDNATFKYVKFEEGVNLSNADFVGVADFKYTKFEGDSDLTNVDFGRRADFKYTTMNGRKFRSRN